jgi:FMN phosphatase YigB (HAD superfamily)
MLIGLDFDNTIVRYDGLFHRLAVERGLIHAELPATKQAVRDFLRAAGREDEWTELQGIAYGPRITDAEPWPGVKDFLRSCGAAGVRVAVVSHKTRNPYRGEKHDLHAAAHAFLDAHGFFASDTGLSLERVFLELTLAEKLARIGSLGCAAFVDDLPEVLREAAFPAGVRKVLFDPADAHADDESHHRVTSWEACGEMLLPREVLA